MIIPGVTATVVCSGLEIPPQIARFLSLYLMFAIGLKGTVSLAENALDI